MKKILEKSKLVLLLTVFLACFTFSPMKEVDTSVSYPEDTISRQVSWQQVKCLAKNIFYESHGEPLAGQLAVAQVTLNRSRDSGLSICSVVYQKKQFSWTEQLPRSLGTPTEEVYNLAQEVLLKGYADKELEDAHFFHTKQVKPIWRKKLKFIKTIGNHKFYGKEPSDARSERI